MANKITYNIGFNVDNSGLKQVQAELQKISNMSAADIKLINPDFHGDIDAIKRAAAEVEQALAKSFNVKLNSYDLSQFNREMQSSVNWTQNLYNRLSELGPVGVQSFNKITSTLLTTKNTARETTKWLDDLSKTFTNTLRWSIASSALNAITGSIQQAWGYTKRLDSSLNDIRIVTGKSADEMERFAKQANKAAKGLGASTTAYTNASLIYYQQGLGEQDVQARTDVTLKAANVTGQSAAEVSQQLTAVWNGYKVVAEEAELYVDKLAAVAATTAADLEELSDGMSKVASAANTMGVDIDQLSAQLATIVSVTRQDASLVGTALKTIYARMGDLKVSGVDEFGTSLGDVSGQMRQMGIEVLDQEGNLREMGEVIEEVAAKWGTWTDAQQQAAAVAIAGKRQYNNLIALFENWNMYESALNTSQTSEGTLQKQQETYMDSLEARLQKLSTATEKFFDALVNNEGVKTLLDIFAGVIDGIGTIVEGAGGLMPILLSLGGVLTRVFNAQIVSSVKSIGGNLKQAVGVLKGASGQDTIHRQAEKEISQQFQSNPTSEFAKDAIAIKEKELSLGRYLTEEQRAQYDARIKELELLHNKLLEQQKITDELKAEKKAIDENIAAERRAIAQKKEQERKDQKAKIDENRDKADALINNKSIGKAGYDNKSQQSRINALRQKRLTMEETAEQIKADKKAIKKDDFTVGTGKDSSWGKLQTTKQDREDLKNANESEAKKILKDKAATGAPVDTKASEQFIKIKQAEEKALKSVGQEGSASYNKLKIAQEAFYRGTISGEKYLDELVDSLNDGAKECDKVANELDESTKALDEMKDKTEEGSKALDEYNKQLAKVKQNLDQVEKEGKETKTEIDNVKTSVNELHATDQKNVVANLITDISGAALQATGVIYSLISAISIFSDENMSAGEKALAFITILLSAVPAIISIIATIKTWKDTANQLIPTLYAQGVAAYASLGPYLIIVGIVIAALVALTAIIVGITKAFQNMTDNGKKAFEEASKAAESATEEFNRVKEAYNELKASLEDYNNAQKAIEALTVGTQEWRDAIAESNQKVIELMDKYPELAKHISSVNGQLKISEEGQEELLKAEQDKVTTAQMAQFSMKQKQLAAKNNMISQQGAADNLDADKRGKAGIWKTVAGAALTIGEVAALATGGGAIVKGVQHAATGPAAQAAAAFGKLATKDIVKNGLANAGVAATVGAGAGIATAPGGIGLLVSGIKDLNYEKEATKGYQKAIELINERGNSILYDEDAFRSALEAVGVTNEEVVQELINERDALGKHALEIEANTQAIKAMDRTAAKTYLDTHGGDTFKYADEKTQEAITAAVARRKQQSDAGEEVRRRLTAAGADDEGLNKKDLKNVAKEYAELMGIEATSTKVDKKTGEITFNLADGSEQKIVGETALQALVDNADFKAVVSDTSIQEMSDAYNRVTEHFAAEVSDSFGSALAEFMSGGTLQKATSSDIEEMEEKYTQASKALETVTNINVSRKKEQDQADAAKKKVEDNEWWQWLLQPVGVSIAQLADSAIQSNQAEKEIKNTQASYEQNTEALAAQFGYADYATMQKDIVDNLGYESVEAYLNELNKGLEAYRAEERKLTIGMTSSVETAWNDLSEVTKDASLSMRKTMVTALEQAFSAGGHQGLNALKEVLNTEQLSEEDLSTITGIFNTIDWKSAGAVEEFSQAVAAAGVNTDDLGDSWDNFLTAMANSANPVQEVITNLNKLRETLKSISEITKDIKIGDIISDEEHKALIAKNKELEQYFVMTADGYAFIGGKGFKAAVKKAQSNTLNVDTIRNSFSTAKTESNSLITELQKAKNGEGSTYFKEDGTFKSKAAEDDFEEDLGSGKYDALLAASGVNADSYKEALDTLNSKEVTDYRGKNASDLAKADAQWAKLDAAGQQKLIEEYQYKITNANDLYKEAAEAVDSGRKAVQASLAKIQSGEWDKMSIDAQTAAVTGATNNYSQLQALDDEYRIDLVKKEKGFTDEQWNKLSKEVQDSYKKNVSGIIDTEEYNKLARMYLAQEAEELGMYFSEAFLQDADNFDTVAAAMEKARKLELDYFKDIEDELNKLDQSAEKAFGQDKLTKLNDISDTLEKSVAQAKENVGWAEDILETSIAANDKEGFFNANGTFKDGMSRDNINNALAKAQAEGDTETVNRLTELLRAYDAKQDADQAIINKSWELVDAQIEAFEHGQNMVREFREFEKEWAQNINKLKNTNFDGLATFAEDFSREFKTSFENLSFSNAQWNSTWSNEVAYLTKLQAAANTNNAMLANGEKNPFWNETTGELDAAKAQEAINEQLGLMYDQYEGLYDEANALYDSIISAGEEINALYDEQIDKLNSANDLLASSIDLYKLVGKGMRGSADDIKVYSEAISANAMTSIEFARAELTSAQQLYNEAVAKGDQEAIEKYAQSQADAAAKYAQTLQNAFNTVAEQFGIQLEAAIDEAIGEGGLQAFSDAWELEKTYDSAYLDSVNAEYAMYEFDRNIQKSIDETDNIIAQNKLIKMRQEQEARLNAIIAERGRLSQHEIDLANAEYELTLKKIALEEAQQTANTMKLTRDAFGNYSYQYVADENKIAEATDEVKAAENELYNLRKEHEKELIDNFGAYLTDYQTQRAEAVAAGNDALVEALDEKYLGENGLLTNLQREVNSLLTLSEDTGLFVNQLDTIANMNFDNLKTNINNLTSSTKEDLVAITELINSGLGQFEDAAKTLAPSEDKLTELQTKAQEIVTSFSSAVDKLTSTVSKLDKAESMLTKLAELAIYYQSLEVGEGRTNVSTIPEAPELENDEGDEGSGSETETSPTIDIATIMSSIETRIVSHFTSLTDSLDSSALQGALNNTTKALEDNTEAIKTLTEELKEEQPEPTVESTPTYNYPSGGGGGKLEQVAFTDSSHWRP